MLKTLHEHARVPCGFAAVNDIRTGRHEDRMDSFVLSETLKYLYLMFADPSEISLDLDTFIFTTEAHLLPLSLGQLGNITTTSGDTDAKEEVDDQAMNYMRSCPSPKHLFPETVRKPLKDLVSGVCPRSPNSKRISAIEFRVSLLDERSHYVCSYRSNYRFLPFRQVMQIIDAQYRTWASQWYPLAMEKFS